MLKILKKKKYLEVNLTNSMKKNELVDPTLL